MTDTFKEIGSVLNTSYKLLRSLYRLARKLIYNRHKTMAVLTTATFLIHSQINTVVTANALAYLIFAWFMLWFAPFCLKKIFEPVKK